MQRTWWPEAGTIIVTGPYWLLGLVPKALSAMNDRPVKIYYLQGNHVGCGSSLSRQVASNLLILKVEYLIICIICDTDLVNKLILQVYTLHKYK